MYQETPAVCRILSLGIIEFDLLLNDNVIEYLNTMHLYLILINATNRMGTSPSCMKQLVVLMVYSLLFINLSMKRPNKHIKP